MKLFVFFLSRLIIIGKKVCWLVKIEVNVYRGSLFFRRFIVV